MTMPVDPVLSRFRAALDSAYGAWNRTRRSVRIESPRRCAAGFRLRRRGVLERPCFGTEAAKIAAIETDILYDTGAVINAPPLRAGSHRGRTGLMHIVVIASEAIHQCVA
jgi:hypothetical protein